MLAILGLLDSPSEGQYILNGKAVENLKASERARIRNREIGFMFQAFNLIGDLTVYENVELPLTYRGMPFERTEEAVAEALERVGMSHRMKHYPSQLSGGQQQRVAVARALVGDPLILLADEPTGNLDSNNGEAVMDLMRELHRGGATICMVTHDPRYARIRTVRFTCSTDGWSKRALTFRPATKPPVSPATELRGGGVPPCTTYSATFVTGFGRCATVRDSLPLRPSRWRSGSAPTPQFSVSSTLRC